MRLLAWLLRGLAMAGAAEPAGLGCGHLVQVVPRTAVQTWPLGQGLCVRLSSCGSLSVGSDATSPDVSDR